MERITQHREQPREIVTTNTVPLRPETWQALGLTTLSIAPLLAEAIHRIHDGRSVSSLFNQAARA